MTIQQLKYILTVAETGSITEAAKKLYLSQPSLSESIKETEREAGIQIFHRSRGGVSLTPEGMEFLGYARQVIQQMRQLESRYIETENEKQRFCVSSQHYSFVTNAFVDLIREYGEEEYEFILNETTTHRVMEDVKNRFADVGILFLSKENAEVLQKDFRKEKLVFTPLFDAVIHVFVGTEHPLAKRSAVSMDELKDYPRVNTVQGAYESPYYAEEPFSSIPAKKQIRVSDRAACMDCMIGLNGYMIATGIHPKYLHGENLVSLRLKDSEVMQIGYLLPKGSSLTELGEHYLRNMKKYSAS